MAQCSKCGKIAQSGNNVSFSQRKTKRRFRPNLQAVTLYEDGKKIRTHLCAKCIKTIVKV